jgi:hypothetical protein
MYILITDKKEKVELERGARSSRVSTAAVERVREADRESICFARIADTFEVHLVDFRLKWTT